MTLPSGAIVDYTYAHATWPRKAELTASAGATATPIWEITERNAFQQPTREHRWGGAVTLVTDRSGLEHVELASAVRVALPGQNERTVSRYEYDARGLARFQAIWAARTG